MDTRHTIGERRQVSSPPRDRHDDDARLGTASRADVSMRILTCPIMYVRDHHGEAALLRIATSAGVTAAQLTNQAAWVTPRTMARFFEGVRSLVADDEAFKDACVHRLRDAYGPLVYLTLAASPVMVMKACARTTHILATMSRTEVADEGRNHVTLRYLSTAPSEETRLVCLSRQAITAAMPTLFGLPRAMVSEEQCIARGDDACVYVFSFQTRASWRLAMAGALTGLVAAYGLSSLAAGAVGTWMAVPACGLLLGALIEVRRTYRANVAFGEQMHQALREVAAGEGEARREILALHQRQKEWGEMLAEQVDARTETLRHVLDQVQAMKEREATDMRGFSHDLRNPLAVLAGNAHYLRSALQRLGSVAGATDEAPRDRQAALRADVDAALDDTDEAIGTMERMLGALMETLVGNRDLVRMAPETIDVAPLAETLRRRVRALVFGRDIRVHVTHSREAPARLHTDPLIFERVMDNLCTNAAKYTDRGTIAITLDGTPAFFVLQVSDTGRGIPRDRLDTVLQPQGGDAAARAENSYGIGLSVTAQLLKQIGGKLTVDSTPGAGTTFWAYFPLETGSSVARNVIDIRSA